jgi:putative transposase
MIFPKHWNMKFAYRNREFRCKEHYVDTVGKNTKAITEYIADQLKRDKEGRPIKYIRPTEPVYR